MPRRKKAGNQARMGEENAAPQADIDQKIKKFEYDLVQTSLFPEYGDGEASVSEAVKKEKEKKKKAEKLAAAEGMLDEILGDDKKGWVNVYRLLKRCRTISYIQPPIAALSRRGCENTLKDVT